MLLRKVSSALLRSGSLYSGGRRLVSRGVVFRRFDDFQDPDYGRRRRFGNRDDDDAFGDDDGNDYGTRRGGGFRRRREDDFDFDGGRRNRDSNAFGRDLRPKDWTNRELAEINKAFYVPKGTTLDRSPEETGAFRSEHRISVVKGPDLPPIMTFDEADFAPELLKSITKAGFEKPTPIQAQGWPIALSGSDMIGIGETGSGKTLGYILPAMIHVNHQPKRRHRDEGPVALVMAPTRELAQQIRDVTVQFYNRPLACLVGGSDKNRQLRDLSRGADIVIATPGRLIDLLSSGSTDLSRCSYVVLDEADRMLDMGFEPQIRKVLSQVRPGKQLLMWSATWPEEVRELARDFFDPSYSHVNIGSTELQANKAILQIVEVCESRSKLRSLAMFMETLDEEERKRVLIFAETKMRVDKLVNYLRTRGFNARGIHGDKTQAFRTSTLQAFRKGQVEILVATSVASRGLDVDDVQVVINFDFPREIEEYVHRIGRTGRRGKSGKAFALFNATEDASCAGALIDVLEEAGQEVNPEIRTVAESRRKNNRKRSRY